MHACIRMHAYMLCMHMLCMRMHAYVMHAYVMHNVCYIYIYIYIYIYMHACECCMYTFVCMFEAVAHNNVRMQSA